MNCLQVGTAFTTQQALASTAASWEMHRPSNSTVHTDRKWKAARARAAVVSSSGRSSGRGGGTGGVALAELTAAATAVGGGSTVITLEVQPHHTTSTPHGTPPASSAWLPLPVHGPNILVVWAGKARSTPALRYSGRAQGGAQSSHHSPAQLPKQPETVCSAHEGWQDGIDSQWPVNLQTMEDGGQSRNEYAHQGSWVLAGAGVQSQVWWGWTMALVPRERHRPPPINKGEMVLLGCRTSVAHGYACSASARHCRLEQPAGFRRPALGL
jgi:hypothetical protein